MNQDDMRLALARAHQGEEHGFIRQRPQTSDAQAALAGVKRWPRAGLDMAIDTASAAVPAVVPFAHWVKPRAGDALERALYGSPVPQTDNPVTQTTAEVANPLNWVNPAAAGAKLGALALKGSAKLSPLMMGAVKKPGGNIWNMKDLERLRFGSYADPHLQNAHEILADPRSDPEFRKEAEQVLHNAKTSREFREKKILPYIKNQLGTGEAHDTILQAITKLAADDKAAAEARAAEIGKLEQELADRQAFMAAHPDQPFNAAVTQARLESARKRDQIETEVRKKHGRLMVASTSSYLADLAGLHREASGLQDTITARNPHEGADWETLTDAFVTPQTKRTFLVEERPYFPMVADEPWFQKLPPDTTGVRVDKSINHDLAGIPPLMDHLHNELTEGRITPEQARKMTIADLARHRLDTERADLRKELEDRANAAFNPKTVVPTDAPAGPGRTWYEFQPPVPEGHTLRRSQYGNEIVSPEGATSFATEREDVVKPLRDSLMHETEQMQHCVGHHYAEPVADSSSRIVSLRDTNGKSHATLELQPYNAAYFQSPNKAYDRFHVAQIKGKQNGPVNPEYHKDIADWLNHNAHNIEGVSDADLGGVVDTMHPRFLGDPSKAPIIDEAMRAGEDVPQYITQAMFDAMKAKYRNPPSPRQGPIDIPGEPPPEGFADGGLVMMLNDPDAMRYELMMQGGQ